MRLDKLKLLKVRNIPLVDEVPEAGKEYLIVLKAELSYIKEDVSEPDGPRYYEAEIKSVEKIQEIGPAQKELKFEKGHSPSQKLRFAVEDYLKRAGKEPNQENYEAIMNKIIQHYNEKE